LGDRIPGKNPLFGGFFYDQISLEFNGPYFLSLAYMRGFMPFYEIWIKENIDSDMLNYFDDLTVSGMVSGGTTISGNLPDQAALLGLLGRIQGLGLNIIMVSKNINNGES
jgi:hypothetical protein